MRFSIKILCSILIVFTFFSLSLGVVLLLKKDQKQTAQILFDTSAVMFMQAREEGFSSNEGAKNLESARILILEAIKRNPYDSLLWARLSRVLEAQQADKKLQVRALENARFLKAKAHDQDSYSRLKEEVRQ